MQSVIHDAPVSKGMFWTGWILTGLASAFLFLDAFGKLTKMLGGVQGTVKLGYPENTIFGIGVTLGVSTLLYVIPRTSVLGAILLTGYLGGAVATHVRINDTLFTLIFPFIIGGLVWAGST